MLCKFCEGDGICERIRFILYLFPLWCQVYLMVQDDFLNFRSGKAQSNILLAICKAKGVHLCHFTAVLVPTLIMFYFNFPPCYCHPTVAVCNGKSDGILEDGNCPVLLLLNWRS